MMSDRPLNDSQVSLKIQDQRSRSVFLDASQLAAWSAYNPWQDPHYTDKQPESFSSWKVQLKQSRKYLNSEELRHVSQSSNEEDWKLYVVWISRRKVYTYTVIC